MTQSHLTTRESHRGAPARNPLLWLILLAPALLLLAYQIALPQRLDIGTGQDAPFIQGLYFPENQGATTFRWSGPVGQVLFTGAGARPWQLRVRASGLHPAGPAPVEISVNGQPVAREAWGGDMAEHEYAITAGAAGAAGNIHVALATEPFSAPPDTRELGLQVDWVELRPASWAVTVPPWVILAGLVIAILVFASAVERATRSPAWALVAGLALIALCAAAIIWFRLQVAVYLPWLLLAVGLLWVFSARVRVARWWEWLLFAGLAVSAVRFQARALDFLRNGAPMADFLVFYDAAHNLRLGKALYDFVAAITQPMGPVFKYPPFYAIMLMPFTVYSMQTVFTGWFLLNVALLVFSTYLLSLRMWRPFRLASYAPAYLIAIGVLNFRPVWESLIRGQMDIIILTAAMIALVLVQARRAEWLAGIVLGIVTMIKLYPGLLVVYLLWRRRWRVIVGFAATCIGLIVLSGVIVGWDMLWRYVTEILTVQTLAIPWPEDQSFDGFVARLFVPSSQTYWDTAVPFPGWARLLFYALDLITLGVTFWVLWRGRAEGRRFVLGYASVMPLMVVMWPLSWIHYQTLMLLPLAVMVFLLWERPAWGAIGLLLLSFVLINFGNEYTVLIPRLEQGWWRLLQSYKLYGDLILLALLLWAGRPARQALATSNAAVESRPVQAVPAANSDAA
jgi:hypothetical protein